MSKPDSLVPALGRSVVAAVVLGLASTAGDWIWARFLTDGSIVHGVVHGVVVFALLAGVLGWAVRSPGAVGRLLATLPAVGLALAAAFYPVARAVGYRGGLLATWLAMWVALALLTEWARRGDAGPGRSLARGLLAAAGSGLAFWAVSGMWTDPGFAAGYGLRFLFWTLAFLPGFAALLARPAPRQSRDGPGGGPVTLRGASALLVATLCWGAAAVAAEAPPRPAPRVLSYELEIGVYPDARVDYAGLIAILFGERPPWNKPDSVRAYPHLTGEAVLRVELGPEPASSLELYLHSELRVHRAWVGAREAEVAEEPVLYPRSYSMVANAATVALDPPLSGEQTVRVQYGGMFNPSYARSPSDYMRIDERGAYLRSHGYSLWFPVPLGPGSPSHAADFRRVTVRTPKAFSAVLGGRRISEEEDDELRTSHWAAEGWDLANLQLTVRPFRRVGRQGVLLYHLDHPESERASQEILELAQRLAGYYAERYRAVETENQLHIAELPNFASGISSGNMIGMTSGQWRRFRSTDEDTSLEVLVAHELVHPYVQPPIDEASPLAALFIEGFPSYFHLPALEEILGREWYLDTLRRKQTSYLEKRRTGTTSWGSPLPEEKPILEISADEIGVYKDVFLLADRVPLFLHFLRERAGPDRFAEMTSELMSTAELTPEAFADLVERFVPGSRDDVRRWLETTEFPDRFRL